MYRTRHFRWKSAHVLVILAHLGLVVAASVAYVYDVSKAIQSTQWTRYQTPIADTHPCGLAMAGVLGTGFTFDVAARTLLKACLAVGTAGLTLNITLLALLLVVEPNRIALTEGEQHWRKQTVTFFGCLANLLLAGAGVGLAVALGIKASSSKRLIAPLVWASIQVVLAFMTAVLDAAKNYREGQDLLD